MLGRGGLRFIANPGYAPVRWYGKAFGATTLASCNLIDQLDSGTQSIQRRLWQHLAGTLHGHITAWTQSQIAGAYWAQSTGFQSHLFRQFRIYFEIRQLPPTSAGPDAEWCGWRNGRCGQWVSGTPLATD